MYHYHRHTVPSFHAPPTHHPGCLRLVSPCLEGGCRAAHSHMASSLRPWGPCAVILWCAAALVVGAHGAFRHDFDYGVASGDPSEDGAVLWTHVSSREDDDEGSVAIAWEVWRADAAVDVGAADVGSAAEVRGVAVAKKAHDFNVKVFVSGLAPRTNYRYRFAAVDDASRSAIGAFRTLPEATAHVPLLRFAIFSCSNYGFGHFNAYDAASRVVPPGETSADPDAPALDFALHLGDYYYEYGDHYPSRSEAVRLGALTSSSGRDLVTLADYRMRHRVTRSDPALQRLTQTTALVAIWDDHEVANNQYSAGGWGWSRGGGAENHDPLTQGSFTKRKRAALRAYHEWMPTRVPMGADENAGARYFRSFRWGTLAHMLVLETRMLNRTDPDLMSPLMAKTEFILSHTQPTGAGAMAGDGAGEGAGGGDLADPGAGARDGAAEDALRAYKRKLDAYRALPSKSLLSTEELAWIRENTEASTQGGVRWQLFGQQVVMNDLRFADMDGAIAQAVQEDPDTARTWQAALLNATCSLPPTPGGKGGEGGEGGEG